MTDETGEQKENSAHEPLRNGLGPVRFRLLIGICGMFASIIGIIGLLGWVLGIPILASLGPGNIPMAPSTAVMFVLYGVTVFLCSRFSRTGVYWTGLTIHAAGALIALSLAVLSYQGIHPEIEHLGFSILHAPGVMPLGHMSPVTALCFLLASLSFLASLSSSHSRPWRGNTAWLLACLLLTISYLFILAYLFGTPLLYGGTFIPPALPTSLAVAALGIGLLALAWPHAWLSLRKLEPGERAPYGLIVTYLILAAGILASGYFFYRGYEKSYRIEVERQLTAIAELKVTELIKWRNERLDDGAVIYNNSVFSHLARRYFENSRDKAAENQLREWMGHYPTHYEYDQVRLLDPKGLTLMSVPAGRPPVSAAVLKHITVFLRSGKIALTDFYRHDHDHKIYLSVLIPISDEADGNRVIGIVALRIDPNKYLYSYILGQPALSKPAETLLVRREGNSALYLNELKVEKDMALKFRVPLEKTDDPTVMAVLGRTGIVEGRDYQGRHLIADIRGVPESQWFLVTRMKTSEVYAPARENLWMIAGFAIALLFGSGAGLAFVWRQQSMGFHMQRHAAAEKLLQEKALNEDRLETLLKLTLIKAGSEKEVTAFALEEAVRLTRSKGGYLHFFLMKMRIPFSYMPGQRMC